MKLRRSRTEDRFLKPLLTHQPDHACTATRFAQAQISGFEFVFDQITKAHELRVIQIGGVTP